MAANFWNSSHKKSWLFTKDALQSTHKKDKETIKLTGEEITRLKWHHINIIRSLGELLGMRQRAIATAIVYFRRIYIKHNFVEFCPKLMAATCMYISSKSEECSTQAPAYKIISEMKKVESNFPYAPKDLLDCEIYALEALEFNLIVYHPYRSVVSYLEDCQATACLNAVWHILNDSYLTDIPLLYPPYVVGLGCIYLGASLANIDLRNWFAELSVEMKEVWLVVNEMIDYYDIKSKEKSKEPIQQILQKLPWSKPHNERSNGSTSSSTGRSRKKT